MQTQPAVGGPGTSWPGRLASMAQMLYSVQLMSRTGPFKPPPLLGDSAVISIVVNC